jgi:hypothetical protein
MTRHIFSGLVIFLGNGERSGPDAGHFPPAAATCPCQAILNFTGDAVLQKVSPDFPSEKLFFRQGRDGIFKSYSQKT